MFECVSCFHCFLELISLRGEKISSHVHKTGSWYLAGFFFNSILVTRTVFCLALASSHGLQIQMYVQSFVTFSDQQEITFFNKSSTKVNAAVLNRPLSHGGHFESQENKKLCFCTSSLALDERLAVQNLLFQHCVIKVYSSLLLMQKTPKKTVGECMIGKCGGN